MARSRTMRCSSTSRGGCNVWADTSSGHGGQVKDVSGDEDDGYDECIYPVDYKQTSHILDDDLHAIMVRPLPAGCRLTAIFDS